VKINSVEIKILMAEHGLTQKALSALCGMSDQYIGVILKRCACSVVNLGRLAKALGVNVRDIIIKED
jgi:DNA-binding Xre family transcriptional regulator